MVSHSSPQRSLRDRIRELEAQLAAQSRKLGDLPTAVAGGPSAAELKDLYDQMNVRVYESAPSSFVIRYFSIDGFEL